MHTIIYFDEFMTTAVIVHFAFCVLYTDLAHFLTIYIDREEFKDEQMVDVKSLDIRNFLWDFMSSTIQIPRFLSFFVFPDISKECVATSSDIGEMLLTGFV